MPTFTAVEARRRLSELVDRALLGERIHILHEGQLSELRARPEEPVRQVDAARRRQQARNAKQDANPSR